MKVNLDNIVNGRFVEGLRGISVIEVYKRFGGVREILRIWRAIYRGFAN